MTRTTTARAAATMNTGGVRAAHPGRQHVTRWGKSNDIDAAVVAACERLQVLHGGRSVGVLLDPPQLDLLVSARGGQVPVLVKVH
jgi:hypothetical protein